MSRPGTAARMFVLAVLYSVIPTAVLVADSFMSSSRVAVGVTDKTPPPAGSRPEARHLLLGMDWVWTRGFHGDALYDLGCEISPQDAEKALAWLDKRRETLSPEHRFLVAYRTMWYLPGGGGAAGQRRAIALLAEMYRAKATVALEADTLAPARQAAMALGISLALLSEDYSHSRRARPATFAAAGLLAESVALTRSLDASESTTRALTRALRSAWAYMRIYRSVKEACETTAPAAVRWLSGK